MSKREEKKKEEGQVKYPRRSRNEGHKSEEDKWGGWQPGKQGSETGGSVRRKR